MAVFRLVSGVPGRCPQCRQGASAATWDRTRPRTAVNGMRPGSMPADPAARADAVAVMLQLSSSAQASLEHPGFG